MHALLLHPASRARIQDCPGGLVKGFLRSPLGARRSVCCIVRCLTFRGRFLLSLFTPT